uniref:ribonuclease catalytic domain-containing protein n=1 Tax=Cyanobium sp. TaxID=2164130 RepID=UPI004049DE98
MGAALPLADWVELVGGCDGPAVRAACWLWLQGPQLLFRNRQGQIEARPGDDLRRLRKDRHRQVLLDRLQDQWHGFLAQRQPIDPSSLAPAARSELELLMAWASGDSQEPLPAALRQALQTARCEAEPGAIRHLLVDLGQWDPHQLPSLRSTTWDHGFSPELEAEAERLLASAGQPMAGDGERLDLMHLRSVTIDDEDTRDIDDGLALELTEAGVQRIWIHVADPGRLVEPESPLDLEARRRGSSLYLARGNLPMFPLQLTTGPFSLRAGERNAAWSIWVELDAQGGVAASGVQRSWVKPTYRLSYRDADELIELAPPQEADLLALHALLELRRRWRQGQGAQLMDQLEGRIRVNGGSAELEITEPGPSRNLVAEAMILAGAVVADLGCRHAMALPYRNQLPATLPSQAELSALPPGPVRHAAIKKCLGRGLTSTTPAAHFSLGLQAYVQATSPIRRYGDLLVQRQLLAHSQGLDPLSSDAMLDLINQMEIGIRQAVAISREDQRHWQQVWFEDHSQGQWPAIFLRWLRPQDQLGLVHVEELGMDLAAECPDGCQPAQNLVLRVQLVDSLRDQLRLRATA